MDNPWDHPASLMRVTAFATAEPQEALLARGTVRELVGHALRLPPAEQRGLLLRIAGPDWTKDHDGDAIRELAARPGFTGAHGAFDSVDLPARDEAEITDDDETLIAGDTSGPVHTDARGQDGEK